MSQLPLELGHRTSYAAGDFLVSPSNAEAFAWIQRWPGWPAPALALTGPAGCGKTHLAHVWQARSGAVLLDAAALGRVAPPELLGDACCAVRDDADSPASLNEAALLHLYNVIAERGGQLLLCAALPPARWPLRLADLRSRLAAIPAIAIAPPDDALLEALLAKLFADRQLAVDRGTIMFIVMRMERSFDAAHRLVAAIDRAALAAHRRPTPALIRELLERDAAGGGQPSG